MSKVPRARSKQIKELQVDFILPLVALNLADVTTSHEASRVLHKFYSEEVTNLFAKILAKDSRGAFFTQPVFEFLSDTCSRVNSNAIITALLDIPYLKQPDQLGSPVAALAFRTIVAIAKNVGLSPKQDVLVNAMVEEELHRAYRKVVVVDFLNAVPFSGMICNYLRSQLELTLERIMLLLACLLPFDPIDEYAVSPQRNILHLCQGSQTCCEQAAILFSEDAGMVSNALEVMENIAPRGIWLRLLPLVDRGNDWKAKHAVGRELYPDLQGGIDDVLEEYLLSPSEIWPAFVLDIIFKNEM